MGKHHGVAACIFYCCQGSKCKKNGSKDVAKQLKKEIKQRGLKDQVWVIKTLCTGHCEKGPIVCVQPDNIWYKEVEEKGVSKILEKHTGKGKALASGQIENGLQRP